MKRRLLSTSIALGILIGGAIASPASATDQYSVARYMVTFKDGVDPHVESARLTGLGLNVSLVYQTLFPGVAVELTADQAATLAANPSVALVERDILVTGNATQYDINWAIDRLDQRSTQIDGSFTYPDSAGAGVVVYAVDSGLTTGTSLFEMTHWEIYDRVGQGYSWIDGATETDDCSGHGTHTAGTIIGTEQGIAKAATVIPARVLDCNDQASMSKVVAALDWIAATRDRAKPTIVNMSLSGAASQTLDTAVNRLFDSGALVVAAAGNDNLDACGFSPARASAAITVGATHYSDNRAVFSNFGPCVDIFAPGIGIESARLGTTGSFSSRSGTSSSAAIVSGLAALLMGQNPTFTPAQIRDLILAQATPGAVLNAGPGSPTLLAHLQNINL